MAVLPIKFTKTKRDKLAQGLWVLKWISIITGIILFSLGIFLKVEINKRQDLKLQSVPNMLIAMGLIACVINFLGGKICYDCVDTNKFLCWNVLVGALMCYSMHGQLEEAITLGLRDAMRYYKDTDTPGRCFLKGTVDLLQIQFQCCGNEGYRDWFQIQWVSNRYLYMSQREVVDRLRSNVEGKYLMDGVLFSCCNVNSPQPCIQYQITKNSAHYNYDYQTEELNLWIRGCHQALLDYYTNIVHSIGLTVLIIWLFELSVLTGVRYLQTSLENMLRHGDPECESDRWLLENSFVETARSNFNIIKHLGKFNQINIASNGDPNIVKPPTMALQGRNTVKLKHT
uniref:Peripherin 2-like a n=1 Tax=Sinocyclocheilus grahami TaxID=75366 RepID=A0A672T5I9_SINGR